MKLENQVCSVDLSKKLKSLGIKQESLYGWTVVGKLKQDETKSSLAATLKIATFNSKNIPYYSAFTAAELGEFLPPNINEWGLVIDATSCLTHDKIRSLWAITYADYDKKLMNELEEFNLANAMAKMLIYLIENKLMEVPK